MRYSIIILLVFTCGFARSQSLVQFRGPDRSGIFKETGLLKQWPEGGPGLIFETEGIGKGFSSPVLSGDVIYVTGMKDTIDYLSAIDLSGTIKWQVPYGRSWMRSYPDTRCTPTIEGDRIYVLSGMGRLACISSTDGKEIWAVDVDKDFEAEHHNWGVAESPLIVDDKVICSPGGKKNSVVAFNKMTGQPVWQSPAVGGQRSYVSPVIYKYRDLRLILAATASNLVALHPDDGTVAFSYHYSKKPGEGLIWAASPVFSGYDIFITMGYNYKAVMLQVDPSGKSVTTKFENTVLDNHHGNVVAVDGYIYGSNWINNGKGNWVCLDWKSGETKYETEWFNKGSIIYADGFLYVYEEKTGNVGLVRPNPEKFEVVSTFQVTKGSGPHWAHPFIADGKLLIRHGNVLMVYNIKS